MNAENEDDFLYLSCNKRENTNLTKRHTALLLRASMLEACRFTSTVWWLLLWPPCVADEDIIHTEP